MSYKHTRRLRQIAQTRLHAQQIIGSPFNQPADLVGYMGAIQSQDYAMSKWAIGLRVKNCTEKDIDKALDKGTILRTHVLRPTWHLVAANDIYWMLALTATRIKARMQTNNRLLGLTEKIFTKSNSIIEKELGKGEHLTREALAKVLEKGKIATHDNRLAHLMEWAELDGIACSGKMKGNKKTYALLSDRVPNNKSFTKDESLAQLATIYFKSRGPATTEDFAWWSGLTLTEARQGLAMVKTNFVHEEIAGKQYCWSPDLTIPAKSNSSVFLLPAFDEFIISYKDRSASLPVEHNKKALTANGIFFPIVVVNGQVSALWKRSIEKEKLQLQTDFFEPPGSLTTRLLKKETKRFQHFAGL